MHSQLRCPAWGYSGAVPSAKEMGVFLIGAQLRSSMALDVVPRAVSREGIFLEAVPQTSMNAGEGKSYPGSEEKNRG